MKDMYIVKVGTADRVEYKNELRMDILGKMINKARRQRNFTQKDTVKLDGL